MSYGAIEIPPVRTIFVDVDDAEMGSNAFDNAVYDSIRNAKMREQSELEEIFPRRVSPAVHESALF